LWPSLASDTLSAKEIHLLEQIKPSGLIFFKRNFSSLEQAKNLVSQIRTLFKPLVLSIDEEGGRVSRLPVNNIRGKSALEFAQTQDKDGLKKQIQTQCHYAKQIGLNCLLAPVADILTEPKNTVMGDRCFGTDAQTVSEFASLVHHTLAQEKMLSCAKHFPGHGNTLTDSHKEFSVSDVSLNQLKNREWLPFQRLIDEKIPFIMAAHVLVPQVDAQNPATLSYEILTTQLRHQLGFTGLILSDDLRMNAIALHYNVNKKQEVSITEDINTTGSPQNGTTEQDDFYLKQASIDALNAGCDILLSCQSIEKEVIIAQAIADKIQQDTNFSEKMLEKAWRIYNSLARELV
ncbi:MAG: glycoside hydrolase family 3 N-terminal domain-containing protein, partial [Bdellovibrionota bacterium]